MNDPTPRQRKARLAGFIGWGALGLLQVAWYAWLFPPERVPLWLVLAAALLPLLLPLLALRRPGRALLWVGILALFYFCHGIAEAWTVAAVRPLALAEVAFSVLLILALGAGVQRRKSAGA